MLQAKDVRLNRTISTKALLRAAPVFNAGVAYIRLTSRVNLVFEFVKQGRRWLCVGLGRADYPNYSGLFSEVQP